MSPSSRSLRPADRGGQVVDVFKPRGDPGGLIEQWRHIKRSASDALIAAGGTITHHHAVGRDHMPWYRAQRPDLFGRAFAAAKRGLDPAGVMNPGVLAPSRAFLRRPEVVARCVFLRRVRGVAMAIARKLSQF